MLPSNWWRFHSFYTIHIKQPGTIFHITESCLPNQFLWQNNKAATVPSITQWIPNIWNTSPHRVWTPLQWSKRWSIDSPLLQHIQHQFTKGNPLLIRWSNVRIQPKAPVRIKNATLLGTLTDQMPFHGNGDLVATQITWLKDWVSNWPLLYGTNASCPSPHPLELANKCT